LISISRAYQDSSEILSHYSETPNLDAQTLLAHVLGVSRAWLIAHPEAIIPSPAFKTLGSELTKLQEGVPLPYVVGEWEFYGLRFKVTPDVLIPRPETELLVEQGLDWLEKKCTRRLVADIGTGSGCIAVSLVHQIKDLQVIATDISLPALRIAAFNACEHSVDQQIHFLQADLMPPGNFQFDLICANLPYIPALSLPVLDVSKREPALALNGGHEGLDLIGRLIQQSSARIKPGGRLLLEIDNFQGEQVSYIARSVFPGGEIEVLQDLTQHNRLVSIQIPNSK
jgi:release factor glutamine methyltransferase